MIGALEQEFAEIVRRVVREEVRAALSAGDGGSPRLVTVAQYAKARSISVSSVRAAIRDGRLDVRRIGRAIRIEMQADIRSRADAPARADTEGRAARVLGLVAGGGR